ncbi:GFA family protein [Aestuariibacter sp. AA17]|uniref:GFA family protein n=1 Tax=Fluctibacter corallii TaxID=2984329 RepID=A0ABT3A4X9_9ALTE|nr:GFA family protein [Aestuariibacter sp. AA17]MCV2883312.1 GFA family protein [Aestuariibacter sp. AA17]
MTQLSGSCLCTAISYIANGTFDDFYLCHCKHCQKDTGSAHAANLFSSNATLQWQSGEDMIRRFHLPETQHIKSFCSKCGSAMPSWQMDNQLLVIPAGSLDHVISTRPTAHIFTSSQTWWAESLDAIPRYDSLPTT